MKRKLLVILIVLTGIQNVQAQKDTTNKNAIYSDIDYDELFNELDDFLDSLTKPRSFAIVNMSVGNRIFNFKSASSTNLYSDKKLSFSPSVGYYNKNGLGANIATAIIKENNGFNAYQFLATASYDYLKNRSFLTGISYTRYFTKDSLNFYTSPLQNEVFSYFSYRRSFLKPSLFASYGWGSRTEVEEREDKIISKIKRGRGNRNNGGIIDDIFVEEITTKEHIRDFNLSLSLSHDFYWLDVLFSDDHVRFTPQVSFSAGTQNFGFNQNTTVNSNKRILDGNVLFSPESYSLDAKTKFQPLSLTTFLKSEFSMNKFFFQPQLMFDYYLPEADQKFTTTFVLSSGFTF